MVPHLLTDKQKAFRKRICEENLALVRQDPGDVLARIITTDETWIATFEPETKRQSSAWVLPNEEPPKKACRQRGQQKTMLTLFFDFQGTVHCEFLQPGDTIRSEDYCETLARMKESVRQKRPHLWAKKADGCHNLLLHQDNASPHTSVFTLAKFGEWGIDLLAHPPTPQTSCPVILRCFRSSRNNCAGTDLPISLNCRMRPEESCAISQKNFTPSASLTWSPDGKSALPGMETTSRVLMSLSQMSHWTRRTPPLTQSKID